MKNDQVCSTNHAQRRNQKGGSSNPGSNAIVGRLAAAPPLPRTADIHVFADPLNKGAQQALISTTLVCAVPSCGKDLSGINCPGIIDLQSGNAYCCAEHWMLRPAKEGRRA